MRRNQLQRLVRMPDEQFICDKTYNAIRIDDRVAFATKSADRVYLRIGTVEAFMYDPAYKISYVRIKSDTKRIVYRRIAHPFIMDVIVIPKSTKEANSDVQLEI